MVGERESSSLFLGSPNVSVLLRPEILRNFFKVAQESEVAVELESNPTPTLVLCAAVTCCIIPKNWVVFPSMKFLFGSSLPAARPIGGSDVGLWDIQWTDFFPQISGCSPSQQKCYTPSVPGTLTRGSHKC